MIRCMNVEQLALLWREKWNSFSSFAWIIEQRHGSLSNLEAQPYLMGHRNEEVKSWPGFFPERWYQVFASSLFFDAYQEQGQIFPINFASNLFPRVRVINFKPAQKNELMHTRQLTTKEPRFLFEKNRLNLMRKKRVNSNRTTTFV